MKTYFKPLLASLLAMLAAVNVHAKVYGTCGDNLSWSLDTSTGLLDITGSGAMSNYHESNQPWANYRSSITSVNLPSGLSSIGDYAFYKCSRLTTITIPESVTSIGDYAFYYLNGLTTITIPESVTSIGNSAFDKCSGLTSLTIPECVTSIGNYAFYKCSGLTSLTIPEGVTSIGDGAFSGCSGLTSLTIPESVTSIGNSAFYKCSGLTSITIPENVTSIGSSAFYGCSGLTSITIPENVTSIGSSAFSGCTGLTSLTIPESVTSIGEYAFDGCTGIKAVTALSATPPTATADLFDSNTYSTAFLYVPLGCEEAYGTAPGWSSFAKLREKDFGTKDCLLTLKGFNGGSVALKCKTRSTYAFQIHAEEGWKVSSMTFNGADATASIAADGSYTTPSLTDDSELCVVFEEEGSAVSALSTEDVLRVSTSGSVLSIQNEGEAVQATIFTTDGKQVKAIEAKRGTTQVRLAEGQVYLVKIGGRTFKVAM